jgi:hypothetical protein
MKVTNLAKKPFLIPVEKAKKFLLAPGSGIVELPQGFDQKYVAALTRAGSVRIEVEVESTKKIPKSSK